MALGTLMTTRSSKSSVDLSLNYHDYVPTVYCDDTADLGSQKKESDFAHSSHDGYMATTTATSILYFPQSVVLCELRHEAFDGLMMCGSSNSVPASDWRMKDRMRTGYIALVLCLNISVDPPDVIKISPCARLECWIDPFSMLPQKALETIGKTLSAQYERWQPKARCKIQLDPSIDDVKKLCMTCRKYCTSDRVLFHYNGHGVPKPTSNGEIWVFNKTFTQYIPLQISDLDSWMGSPSVYVFDCSAAGLIVNMFIELHDWKASTSSGATRDCILLAACEAHESLPQNSEFPADLFTSCLTTPIKMALRWFCKRSLLHKSLDYMLFDKIPGRQTDRKTLLGELNWIFTAVTDTIAWSVLPHDVFRRLFRQDLLVASLFRNFLLAQRIMRTANCSPISHPMLPPTHQHHMWDAWDMAAEICLCQLPKLVEDSSVEFQPSPFFTEQLTAFEIWLDHGSEYKKPPEQLPIVLQVLLSQYHRFRALVLLGRFLDMGAWAVHLALSVGIFPYVLKLLQTTTPELRQILVFLWTKILALDKSCQVDLVKDGGHLYFIRFLDSTEAYPEQRAMAAFVLAAIVDGYRQGQEACVEAGAIHMCLNHLQGSMKNDAHSEPLFLQWLCLCLGKLWDKFTEAQMIGFQAEAPAIFAHLLLEPQPEVRASAVFALGTLLDVSSEPCRDGMAIVASDDDEKFELEINLVRSLLNIVSDASPLVRAEIAIAVGRFTFHHRQQVKAISATYWKPCSITRLNSFPSVSHVKGHRSGYGKQSEPIQSTVSSQIASLFRVGSDSQSVVHDGRATSSSPCSTSGILLGSPPSDDSSQISDSILSVDLNHSRHKSMANLTYSQCILAMCSLSKDPSPYIASMCQKIVSIVGIEQTLTKRLNAPSSSHQPNEHKILSPNQSLAFLARSSSWFDITSGQLPLAFRTPPVSPPRGSYLTGIRRVCSLDFRPHLVNNPDSGLADPLLNSIGSSASSEQHSLPQSFIYNWSCGHFSRPLLNAADDIEETLARRQEREKLSLELVSKCHHASITKFHDEIAGWDTKFDTGGKAVLLKPFSSIVIASDKNECIRVWDYEEANLLNGFDNHDFAEKGISKLCLLNELDNNLLLVASCDGNIRVWKDYTLNGKQKLVTAFSSIQSHKPSMRCSNAVVDWQQQSGYLYSSSEMSSLMVWDMEKEWLLRSILLSSDIRFSVLSASQVHAGQFVAGLVDGSLRFYDARAPEMLVYVVQPHAQKVMGIAFQPGIDPTKAISASQAGDIQFLDLRTHKDSSYLTIDAHRGSLTALAVHRHAPIIASGSAKQIIKVFSMEGQQLGTIRYRPTLMAQKIAPVNCLAFHPYRVLLAAGASDGCVSIYAADKHQQR